MPLLETPEACKAASGVAWWDTLHLRGQFGLGPIRHRGLVDGAAQPRVARAAVLR
jgi:hypothetical protein